MKKYTEIVYDNNEALDKIIFEKKYTKKESCTEESCSECKLDIFEDDYVCKKKILENNKEEIKKMYALYSRDYKKKEHRLKIKEALKNMFNSKTKTGNNLIFLIKKNIENKSCPYCGLGSGDTVEHILPKEDFPEFSMYSNNLIPCCSMCNILKGTTVKNLDNNEPETFNFYTDDIPNEELIRVEIKKEDGAVGANYILEDDIKNKIFINHIGKLKLLERYKENSNRIFSEFAVGIKKNLKNQTVKSIKKTCIEAYNIKREVNGYNYYEALLYKALSEADWYIEYLLGPYKNVNNIDDLYEKTTYMKEIDLSVKIIKNGSTGRILKKEKDEDDENKLKYKISRGEEILIEIEASNKYTHNIMWKVINSGEEAEKEDKIRGELFAAPQIYSIVERLDYIGESKIECYFIENNICKALGSIIVKVIS